MYTFLSNTTNERPLSALQIIIDSSFLKRLRALSSSPVIFIWMRLRHERDWKSFVVTANVADDDKLFSIISESHLILMGCMRGVGIKSGPQFKTVTSTSDNGRWE
ncbi:hypothetical protein GJ496_009819 [Pomphorhynchus laevis]|nr:hypothetical protein GJ496_009819 [Pomphorhynchus laevis]